MAPKRAKKKKAPATLADSIEQRRRQYSENELRKALEGFFAAVDEDGSGYLESHEFVVAQRVVAELAGDNFDHDAAEVAFGSMTPWDKNGDKRVTLEEFTQRFMEICDVITMKREEIVKKLTDGVAMVVSQARRELGREIRRYFVAIDANHDNSLSLEELQKLEQITTDLVNARDNSSQVEASEKEKGLNLKDLDKDKNGSVDSDEFANHLAERIKMLKLPKVEVVQKLRGLTAALSAA